LPPRGYLSGQPRLRSTRQYGTPDGDARTIGLAAASVSERASCSIGASSPTTIPGRTRHSRDHFGATLPGMGARLRLEFPPVRTNIELIDAGQNPCNGVLPRFALLAGDDFEQQLASLDAAGCGDRNRLRS